MIWPSEQYLVASMSASKMFWLFSRVSTRKHYAGIGNGSMDVIGMSSVTEGA